MIFALVPLTVYRVTYELTHGRPYSKFEELLLKSVGMPPADHGRTFAELREVFQVHDRLLTEGLVTLIQEGWVAMEQSGAEVRYLATEEGKRTIDKGRRPTNRRTRTSHATIVRERLTGQLARASDLSYMSATSLRGSIDGPRKARRQALTPKVMRTEINGGETERLLPRSAQRQEWVRWINSVSQVSQDLHYLPVQVDLDAGRVLGLPYSWQHLTLPILEEVTDRSSEMADNAAVQEEIREFMRSRSGRTEQQEDRGIEPFAMVRAVCADTAITARETASLIEDVLAKCVGHVLLAVGNLDARRAAALSELLIRLVSGGIKVDVLWSTADHSQPSKEIFSVLSRARSKVPRDTLLLNPESSGIAADLLLAETADGPMGIVGSSIAEPELGDNALVVSARISDPAVLAALARLGAGFWETVDGDQAKLVAHRWKHYAERWADEGTLSAAPESAVAVTKCPYHPTGHCSGEIVILTGAQQQTARAGMLGRENRRILLADGRSVTDHLLTEFATGTGDWSGCLYQAFGGADGWYFLRRNEPGKWADYNRPDFTPPSPAQRVTGTATQWLISPSGDRESALSVWITGHIAATAWERTSRAHPQAVTPR